MYFRPRGDYHGPTSLVPGRTRSVAISFGVQFGEPAHGRRTSAFSVSPSDGASVPSAPSVAEVVDLAASAWRVSSAVADENEGGYLTGSPRFMCAPSVPSRDE